MHTVNDQLSVSMQCKVFKRTVLSSAGRVRAEVLGFGAATGVTSMHDNACVCEALLCESGPLGCGM